MEWIKRMSLKRALFTMALTGILISLLLSVVSFWACAKINAALGPQRGLVVHMQSETFAVARTQGADSSQKLSVLSDAISLLQIGLPAVYFTIALLATASLFYRWKLKEPLRLLSEGADRIMANDLDFSVAPVNGDELGRLCDAFERMRQALVKNNRQLWQQTEERRRLNAAFAHDLRNPLTVLTGSVKLAKQWAEEAESHPASLLLSHLNRIESYTGRMERYVETMSRLQKLEELPLEKKPEDGRLLAEELEQAIRFAAQEAGKQVFFCGGNCGEALLIDRSALFQIAENLTTNALRFAKTSVSVALTVKAQWLTLTVTDDGNGFAESILKNGPQPFQKGREEAEHFGMGLYICHLLCRKHGGMLRIKNSPQGAIAVAVLELSQG